MPRVTLATIAAAAGLSKFAVSRALSGKNGVSEETRRRVQAIAVDLGYTRSPAGGSNEVLGLVFHDTDLINSELHLLIQSGVQKEALRRGYQVRMRWTHLADEIEGFISGCAGAVMVGPHDAATYARIYALDRPIVRTGWLDPLEQVDFVGGTDHEAGSAVANYLLALGHRTIAYVHGAPGYRGRVERYYGMREVIERREDVQLREMMFKTDVRFTEHLLGLHDEGFQPTAFFCAHDGLAVTVISELLRLGYRIPEDASVIGYGDYSAARQISPPLTTVRMNGEQIGASCVRLLDDRLNKRMPDVPLRLLVAGQIVDRVSCGPLRPGTAALRADQQGGAVRLRRGRQQRV